MIIEEYRKKITHMNWADKRIWQQVLKSKDCENDDYIRKMLHHIHSVQNSFLQVFSNQPVKFTKLENFDSLQEIKIWCEKIYQEYLILLDTLTEEKLSEEITIPWAKYFSRYSGVEAATTQFSDAFEQVVYHSTYHRAQVNKRIRELNGEPIAVDYIAWIWFGKPNP
ncbi:MAG: hypothetical protein K9J12_13550 [Melioribacteraceae bacterium]|nr:hypothetical protein [Melioribacteraceae bacterium]MCF8263895.1 hypothetical protein [Melioribacteraceae bacterium]MCF8414371.1 hypothetical protein [Melioribacteraceae bacterium]MCF8430300.1 hypothetical protein [Melioribacteraceae bacterium]